MSKAKLLPRYIILHSSDTEDGETLSWPAIKRYHVEVNGWSDIGYHYGLERYRNAVVALPGRPWWRQGAHCRAAGRNRDSLGVCVVGRFEDSVDPLIWRATVDLLTVLCWAFGIRAGHVFGHREFEAAKTCPGRAWDLDAVREGVERRLRGWTDLGPHLRMDLLAVP